MGDPRWLRLIAIGLILAALAVGYFLLSGRLTSNSTVKTTSHVTPSASPTLAPTSTPASAYTRIVNRTQGGVQTLPKTGFPQPLAGIFSVGIMIFGWNLRKFPH